MFQTPPRMIRHYQNRSSSLPRGIHHYDYDDNRRGSVDCFEQPSYFDFKVVFALLPAIRGLTT